MQMEHPDVSLIQTRLDVARASVRARQLARQDMPEPWVPVVLDALAEIARLGVVVERAAVEFGCLRIIMATQDQAARAIEERAAIECARLSGMDELRLLVLTRCRQLGPDGFGRVLASDRDALEAVRGSHAQQPSRVLAVALAAADAAMALGADRVVHGVLGHQRNEVP